VTAGWSLSMWTDSKRPELERGIAEILPEVSRERRARLLDTGLRAITAYHRAGRRETMANARKKWADVARAAEDYAAALAALGEDGRDVLELARQRASAVARATANPGMIEAAADARLTAEAAQAVILELDEASKPGRPERAVHPLIEPLAKRWAHELGEQPSASRDGRFGRVVALLLQALGEPPLGNVQLRQALSHVALTSPRPRPGRRSRAVIPTENT
jgi:hypothetical protein